jgi:hypothetical protein
MFLERVPYRSMRRRKIRNWLLLLVRAAALGLLVVAFARPLLTDVDLAAGTVLGPREVVVLLDRSYSMSVGDRWSRAVAAVRDGVGGLEPVDRASLILFDSRATATHRSTSDTEQLLRALDRSGVGSMGTQYGPALKLAESLLTDSDLPNKEVVLVSDFQRAGWTGEEDARFPETVRMTTVAVAGPATEEPPENASVVDVELRRDVFSGRERVTVAGRISHVGGQASRAVPVTLSVDGREIETRTVEVAPNSSAGVTFEPFTLPGSFTRGEVAIESDELAPDDARRFVLSREPGASVLLVRNPSDARSSLYLERALEISAGAGYRVDTRSPAALAAEMGERAVVIVSDVALAGSSLENLTRFAEGGGGVLLILGEASRLPSSAPDLVPAVVGGPVDREDPGRLGYLDYSHPVLEAFAGPNGGDFSRARFYRYRRLVPSDSARIIARYDDGAPAMVEGRLGRGRVIVWASSADNFWNDLVLQPLFLPLLHQTVDYLTGHAPSPNAYTAGDVLDLSDPGALGLGGQEELPTGAQADRERVALTPSGGSVPIQTSEERAYLGLDEHGFYEIRAPGSDESRPVTVAVNVDVAESDLRTMDPEELVLATRGAPVAESGESREESPGVVRAEDLERRQGFWRFLLVGAFLLLAVETVMSNRLSSKQVAGLGGGHA